MDRQKLETKLLDFSLFWMVPHHISQHINVRVPLHRTSLLNSMNGWTRSQMNPKAIRADMAFHQLHDMQAFHRMHNVKRLPTGPHTHRGQIELRWVFDCSRSFSRHSWLQPRKIWTRLLLFQITPAQLMRKAATVRHTQVTLSGRTPMEPAKGRRPRDLMDPASMDPEQLTSTPTKQDLFNEEIQKLALKTHLEVQQREDIRRDLAERMKCVPPDLRVGESVFYWQEDPSNIQQGR